MVGKLNKFSSHSIEPSVRITVEYESAGPAPRPRGRNDDMKEQKWEEYMGERIHEEGGLNPRKKRKTLGRDGECRRP